MEVNQIISNANLWVGCRVKLKLKIDDSPWKVKGSQKKTISFRTIELTSHGYDEDTNTLGDDNYGYHPEDIESIEFVREAKQEEMGCIIPASYFKTAWEIEQGVGND